MEFLEFTGKTVDDALTEAAIKLETTSDKIDYEVIEKGSSGILGFGSKLAKIKARKKNNIEDIAVEFLNKVFNAMNLAVNIHVTVNMGDKIVDSEL